MPNPMTDIILLTYNNVNLLDKFFNCIYKNTKDFNLIIVDNNSKDNSVDFIKKQQKKESNITLIEEQTNLGVAGGRNRGIKEGKAEYVICLDSDQFVGPNWLDELFIFIEKGFDYVGVDAWLLNNPKHPRPYFPFKRIESPYHKFSYVGGGGCLMKRGIFEELGFYDEQFNPMYFEDPDAIYKALKSGYRIGCHFKHKIFHMQSKTKLDFSRQNQFQVSYKKFKDKWFPYYPRLLSMVMYINLGFVNHRPSY